MAEMGISGPSGSEARRVAELMEKGAVVKGNQRLDGRRTRE